MKSYSEAGVDIGRGDRFVDFIKSIKSRAVDPGIGGFSSALPLESLGFKSPVLMTTTDGTGTKLLVARSLGKFDTIGIDLVAVNVNDLVVCGAKPVVFLDYIACGAIHEKRMQDIMQGIVRGCEMAGCTLGGGETAEMPDLYGPDDFDLAGFAVGLAEKDSLLPRKAEIKAGDLILGIPSSGIHSNGLTLARKVIDRKSVV
jgi:phosphoribosylformylglycinamidine cyclo-ligase